ncbi:MAG: (2Fe-2S) ferredoxin domain-containing protein [Rubrobacteraceae bacterium]
MLDLFRREVERHGYSAEVVQRNPCSRRHHEGPVVFVFPDDVWYTEVEPDDVSEIVERHLVKIRASPSSPSPSRRR